MTLHDIAPAGWADLDDICPACHGDGYHDEEQRVCDCCEGE